MSLDDAVEEVEEFVEQLRQFVGALGVGGLEGLGECGEAGDVRHEGGGLDGGFGGFGRGSFVAGEVSLQMGCDEGLEEFDFGAGCGHRQFRAVNLAVRVRAR